jgi:hypothetical protein
MENEPHDADDGAGAMMNLPPSLDPRYSPGGERYGVSCEHGRLARKCEVCDLQAEVARLAAERDALALRIRELQRAIEILYPEPAETQDDMLELGVLRERAPDDVRDSPCDDCVCEGRGPCYDFTWRTK